MIVPESSSRSPTSSKPTTPPAASPLRERVLSLQLPRENKPRPAAWLRWLAVAAVLIVVGWIIWKRPGVGKWFGGNPPAQATPQAAADEAPPDDDGIVLYSPGYIVPAHQILVSPKVQGMVVKLNIEEGRRVEKGDVLAEIERIEFERDLERAKAMHKLAEARWNELKNGNRAQEIAQAKAELDQAQEEFADLKRVYERNAALWRTQSITEQELQSSQSRFLAMQKRIEGLTKAHELMVLGARTERIVAAEAEAEQFKAEMLKAEWRLGNCTIKAPISGTILKKNAEEGNIVNPLAFNGSFSLCEMADLSELEVDLAIPEQDVAQVFQWQRCRIEAKAFPDRAYDGYVSRLMPIADRAKAAVPVRVKIRVPPEEEGKYLKPEMGAVVSFYKDKVEKAASAAEKPTLP